MNKIISSDVFVAYSQCHRKAYLLLFTKQKGKIHEYTRILHQQKISNQHQYINVLKQKHSDVQPFVEMGLTGRCDFLVEATLQADGLEADCGLLIKVKSSSALGRYSYEPTIFAGTHTATKEQRLQVMFAGYVLGQMQKKQSAAGRIIRMEGRSTKVKLEDNGKTLIPILEPLQEWVNEDSPEAPPVILNKHCSLCQFRSACQAKAEQEDNLSLLDRVTPKVVRQYEKKGIFTVKQLSYLYKPRKRKKRAKNPPKPMHKIELQALAIRTEKIYLQELPELTRQPVELFLDLEGVPDRGLYYLIGLLMCEGETREFYSFWADGDQDEEHMWRQFLEKVNKYPEAPIYHYGSYEPRAIVTLSRRYGTDSENLTKRLVNVNNHIYGKVYFPVCSNSLKVIGEFIGASWTSPDASGLQSLVWRYYWDQERSNKFRELLLTYNREDCFALHLISKHLFEISERQKELENVVELDRYKEKSTPVQTEVSRQFNQIIKLAHFEYDKKKISFSQDQRKSDDNEIRKQRQNARKAQHEKYLERKRRAKRKIRVQNIEICPECNHKPLQESKKVSRRYIIDLILTRNGVRKAITEYFGFQGYCTKCQRNRIPPGVKKYGIKQAYGHGFGSWIVYQRVELRLSYDNIVKSLEEQFNESIRSSLCVDMIKRFGKDYSKTKDMILEQLLQSPFIHVDETRANIRGENWYVWCFTDGKNTIYKLHYSREAEIAQEFFADYEGVVISDFYAGYDSLVCEQQKCWVHLIRDLNNSLRESPFDIEFENLVLSIKNLIIPIMESVIQYGLKKYHLKKFERQVNKFYKERIDDKVYKSDITQRYQKRFVRYRSSLFTFLRNNDLPWHNNTAESAMKHFAKQRDASGPMYESVTHDYLTLLSIYQTCRNHNKSFLQFLCSEKIDIYTFKRYKR